MIAELQSANMDAFLAACALDPLFGAQLRTDMLIYGLGSRTAQFWLATNAAGAPAAALSRIDGRIWIAAGVRTDLTEMSVFLRAVGGFDKVTASKGAASLLHVPGRFFSAPIMEYRGGCFRRDYSAVTESLALDELYRISAVCFPGFRGGNRRDEWYVYTSHMVRHGFGVVAGVRERGRLAATAGIYAIGGGYGVIGSVATYPRARRRGYGALLVRYLSDRIIEMGLTPALFCAEDSLAHYYGGIGFRIVGEWGRVSC